MGMDVKVKMRLVVKKAEGEVNDDGERLFGLLRELAAGGIRVLEPMTVVRLSRLDQLQCTVDSCLRTKTGFERFLCRRRFAATHLPTLCRQYSIEAEVWTSCGEAGYDEHFVVGYNGKVLVKECFETTPWAAVSTSREPSPEEVEWCAKWGKWTIPTRAEYQTNAERKRVERKRQASEPDELPF